MSKSDDRQQNQGQQDQNVQVMKTKDKKGRRVTMIQTGPGSVQVNGDLHGGIRQNFS